MMIEPIVKELLEAGVHFGHQTHRWNPKMRRFIFGEKNGIYIVDLEKTAQGLEQAREFLRGVAAEGAPILFVGTKRQAQPIIAEEALRCGQFYVNFRWLGGLLTNFMTVRKSIERLKTLQRWKTDGTLENMTKKEAAQAEKELAKLERVLKGIQDMGRLPKAMYVVDAKREETAVKEALRLGIPVVSLVDTNSDPDPISYVIPGNDDALRSIKLITRLLADAVLEGQQAYLAGQAEAAARAESEKREAEAAAAEKAQAEADKAAGKEEKKEEISGEVVEPAVDEVEKIIPAATLKTKVEVDDLPKKKKAVKTKVAGTKEIPEKSE